MFKQILNKAIEIVNGFLNKYDNDAYIVENMSEDKAVATLASKVGLVHDFYESDMQEGHKASGNDFSPLVPLAGAWESHEGLKPTGMALVSADKGQGIHLFLREDWEQGDTVHLSSFEATYKADALVTEYRSTQWSDVASPTQEVITITTVTDQDYYDPDAGVWVDNPTETVVSVGVYVWGQDPVFTETVTYSYL